MANWLLISSMLRFLAAMPVRHLQLHSRATAIHVLVAGAVAWSSFAMHTRMTIACTWYSSHACEETCTSS